MGTGKYKMVNGEVIELTEDEVKELDKRHAEADLNFTHVRSQRDGLLSSSDWTQLADATLGAHTAEEWAAYRQELRDLPSKHSKVSEVVFPDDPPTAAAKAAE
jgi:predicted oxidoreductase (fatty acid repression mutant protein)